jgi:Holliday junction resolvase RusA-like endonuclease
MDSNKKISRHIVLLGKPISTGTIYKTMCRGNFPCTYLTSKGKVLKESYQWQAKSQWKGKTISTPITVVINTYHDNHRKNDWDNFHKLSMDALTGIVYEDDSQIIEAIVKKHYDHLNPRIEIDLSTCMP